MGRKDNGFSYQDGISLKEYCDTRFEQNDKEVKLAADALNIRVEHLNEFRKTLQDQSNSFLSRNEYDAKHQLLENKIDSLQKIVYIGMGMVMLLEILFKFFIK